MIKFDFNTYVNKFISEEEIRAYDKEKERVKNFLSSNGELMGWTDLNLLSNPDLLNDIRQTGDYIRSNCDVLLVIGIGGSYLGPLAVIEALNPYFYNNKKQPEIYFLGTSFSSEYYNDLVTMIENKQIMVNVISKSGTTLETVATYDLVMDLMNSKYTKAQIKERVIVTTDFEKGALREEVNKQGYKSFTMPNTMGGRYSVFSPVGLLPISASGIDIEELFKGAKMALNDFDNIYRYAAIRDIMYHKGKVVEAYIVYEPKLASLSEWLKQLFGESLGKENKGILPISLVNVRDLHSMGQFIQEGNKILFETVINVETSSVEVKVKKYKKSMNEINQIAIKSTAIAHQTGGTLNNIINMDELNAYNIGYLLQYFMLACAAGGYIEGVNPFDQNGVEEYKNVMRSFL